MATDASGSGTASARFRLHPTVIRPFPTIVLTRAATTSRNIAISSEFREFSQLDTRKYVDPDSNPDDGGVRAGRIGRRIALAVYWVFLIYIAIVGFYSVVPQVFWPPRPLDETAQAVVESGCEEGSNTLRTNLREVLQRHVGGEPNQFDAFERWDSIHLELTKRCAERAHDLHQLETLRYQVATTMRRFDREDGRAFAELRQQ